MVSPFPTIGAVQFHAAGRLLKIMPKLRNIALTVQELEDGEFYWVLMEATDDVMEEALPYLPLEAAQDPYSSYGDALVAGLAMLRKLFGKEGPRV